MGSLRDGLRPLYAAARDRWYPHGTRHRRSYRRAAQLLLALVAAAPLAAIGWLLVSRPGPLMVLVVLVLSVLLPLGAALLFPVLDRARPGRAPWWKAVAALVASPVGVVLGVLALVRRRPALAPGAVLWAEVPNDEDRGATSKVRPVVVVADRGGSVLVRWFTSQDKSSRHDYVRFGTDDQRACGLGDVGHTTWLSTEARSLPRSALREQVGTAPERLLDRRPA